MPLFGIPAERTQTCPKFTPKTPSATSILTITFVHPNESRMLREQAHNRIEIAALLRGAVQTRPCEISTSLREICFGCTPLSPWQQTGNSELQTFVAPAQITADVAIAIGGGCLLNHRPSCDTVLNKPRHNSGAVRFNNRRQHRPHGRRMLKTQLTRVVATARLRPTNEAWKLHSSIKATSCSSTVRRQFVHDPPRRRFPPTKASRIWIPDGVPASSRNRIHVEQSRRHLAK